MTRCEVLWMIGAIMMNIHIYFTNIKQNDDSFQLTDWIRRDWKSQQGKQTFQATSSFLFIQWHNNHSISFVIWSAKWSPSTMSPFLDILGIFFGQIVCHFLLYAIVFASYAIFIFDTFRPQSAPSSKHTHTHIVFKTCFAKEIWREYNSLNPFYLLARCVPEANTSKNCFLFYCFPSWCANFAEWKQKIEVVLVKRRKYPAVRRLTTLAIRWCHHHHPNIHWCGVQLIYDVAQSLARLLLVASFLLLFSLCGVCCACLSVEFFVFFLDLFSTALGAHAVWYELVRFAFGVSRSICVLCQNVEIRVYFCAFPTRDPELGQWILVDGEDEPTWREQFFGWTENSGDVVCAFLCVCKEAQAESLIAPSIWCRSLCG